MNIDQASLTLVGSGIKAISHLTEEAKAYIQHADQVCYLLNEPVAQKWIEKNNKNAFSLEKLYTKYPKRVDNYRAITDVIVEAVIKEQHVCVVLYGHPTVFAQPGLEAVRVLRSKGYTASILPGISAEDCLFVDLLINPGECGCQSFETTDFLIYQRNFDSRSHLVLWQVGIIGCLGHTANYDNHHAATILSGYLTKYYGERHEVVLYEAAQYPTFKPRIDKLPLNQLSEAQFSAITTLYVPPNPSNQANKNMLKALNIECS
ncbi:SAM-dependent methyltransferase [Piscirickettsia litoralis]|uniref:Tetrapyrrole methylase domain-containing protein n=1 Tax=Piscirickettsia litoralis TaxID=1891921 RepID=A0ABX3A2V1_9GAMM|nr:SAM-dependent methyltransferase [Piscirickettsia litoralis]ODN43201.1 hypothetical protein BGC07_10070 [Piscirickettsia litoralis]